MSTGVSGDSNRATKFGTGVEEVVEGYLLGDGVVEAKGFAELETRGSDFDEVIHEICWNNKFVFR